MNKLLTLAALALLPAAAFAKDCTVATLGNPDGLAVCAERMLKSACRNELVSALRSEKSQWPEQMVRACCASYIQSFDPPRANICNPNVALTSEAVAERELAKIFKEQLIDRRVGLDAETIEKASKAMAQRLTAKTFGSIPADRQCPALTILLSFKPDGPEGTEGPSPKHLAPFPTGATATGTQQQVVLENVEATVQALHAYAAHPDRACVRGSPRPLVVLIHAEEEYRSAAKSLVQGLRASGAQSLYLGPAGRYQDDLKFESTPWPRL